MLSEGPTPEGNETTFLGTLRHRGDVSLGRHNSLTDERRKRIVGRNWSEVPSGGGEGGVRVCKRPDGAPTHK